MIPNLFISYSHRDEVWRNELVRHLRVLERSGILRIWETSEIQAGANWAAEIMEKLQQADLAVILVSPDALASDYIVDKELGAMIRRQREGQLVVVPVLLRSSPWTAIEGFAELQFANSPSKPLAELSAAERDVVLAQIAERIGSLARAVSQQKKERDEAPSRRLPGAPGTLSTEFYFISHAREDGDFAELVSCPSDRITNPACRVGEGPAKGSRDLGVSADVLADLTGQICN
jgi:hypothetical protein